MHGLMLLTLWSLACSVRAAYPWSPLVTQFSFSFPEFTEAERHSMIFGYKAAIVNLTNPMWQYGSVRHSCLVLTPDADAFQNTRQNLKAEVKGKAFYYRPIRLRNRVTTASFSTSFTFTMKGVYPSMTGDGLAFVMAGNPKGKGDSLGHFGFFPHRKRVRAAIAVEFDTLKNHELEDIDSNHVGLDIADPISRYAVSADGVGIDLNNGRPITAWIDYTAPQTRLEVRVQVGFNRSRPARPLLDLPLDLSKVVDENMWIGFSAATNYGVNQLHSILSWSFTCDVVAPDPKGPLSRTAIIIICVLCGSFLILLVVVLLCWWRRNKKFEIVPPEKSWFRRLLAFLLEKDQYGTDPQEPTAKQNKKGKGKAQTQTQLREDGVMSNCLPFSTRRYDDNDEPEEHPPRAFFSRYAKDADATREEIESEEDTIMYSNSVYNSDDEDPEPLEQYPEERLDAIAFANSKPKPSKPRDRNRSPPRRRLG